MKHDVALRGHRYGLRPVALSDAAFIVALRAANGRFLNRGATTEAEQRTWLEGYFARAGDYYFVIDGKADGDPEGLVGIYGVDAVRGTAEWGRFLVRPGSLAAVEAALLVYRGAFTTLGLRSIRCLTLKDNAHVVAFHDSCGLERTPATAVVDVEGVAREAVEHFLTRERWPAVDARLDRVARRLARAPC